MLKKLYLFRLLFPFSQNGLLNTEIFCSGRCLQIQTWTESVFSPVCRNTSVKKYGPMNHKLFIFLQMFFKYSEYLIALCYVLKLKERPAHFIENVFSIL